MKVISRSEFKTDPGFKPLHDLIKSKHQVPNHTIDILLKNADVKDFCEESRHFAVLSGRNPIYLHYDVSSWFKEPNGVLVSIDSIAIYNNYSEYESARRQQLGLAKS
ncbi:hypothetical protein LZD49_12535 [Dyadobacter sp. CY261]|uniref:hypothetical protein n=1 Tax=Dyadobacter sp. CY261 TaxID=2907203 RepID=UPI001F44EB6B|nr:hypothetical protein [Dyadobacter sp. CY261]MCF0071300.1 hypothetical protein [Dyadobacter sp. CY261]